MREILIVKNNGNEQKMCSKCKTYQNIDMFCKSRKYKSGLNSACKICEHKRIKKYNLKNSNKIKKYHSDYYLKNKKRILKTINLYNKTPERKRKLSLYLKNKRKNNPNYRLINNACKMQNAYFKGKFKYKHTMELIGLSPIEFRKYVESKWLTGMKWDNYGNKENQWSLDHILCLNLFDFLNPLHQEIAINFRNIRPIWHTTNIKKGDYLIDGRRARDLSEQEKEKYIKKYCYWISLF